MPFGGTPVDVYSPAERHVEVRDCRPLRQHAPALAVDAARPHAGGS
jgi:hypothetical protein